MIEAIHFEQGSRKVTVTIINTEIIKEIISCLAAHTTWQLSFKHYERAAQLARQVKTMNKRQKKKKYGKDWKVWMVLWGGHPKRMFVVPKKSPYETLTTILTIQRVIGRRKKGKWTC